MKNKIRWGTLILASALVLTAPIFSDGATDATVQSYEDRLAYATQKQQAALEELERLRNEQAGVWYELTKYDELITITEQKKVLAEEQLDSIELQIKEKEQEIVDTTGRIESQEDAFLKRMVSNYMEGDVGTLELLFNAENLVDFLARIDRINAVKESDRAIIDQLNEDRNSLDAAKTTLEDAKTLQSKTIKDFEAAIKDTKGIYEAKQYLIEELQNNEAEAKASYEYFSQLERELNAELENYLAELQKKQQSVYVGGSLAWPLDPTAPYWYSSEFGYRILWGQPDNHLGLDIACNQNTKILAANGGTVLKSEWHWSYGNYVLIDHGGGMATLYAHMTSRAVSAGQTVSLGDVIGYVGMTGSASGHHLHFEVRKNGAVQQPRDYIVGPNG